MYFKRLELVGFKSFMDKTVLNFEPGITAVVGPNGCGKSNVFDSIRWVLGEQSAKALRGSDMQDIIFNGTDTKQAVGMAEVSLSFDNENKHFPLEHEEVTITRRIFRSGESEYLLNRQQVRLKDIQDLLLGTGIGAESYSIIAQGKIDLILSSKPEDRRMVFDEASGITKYKAQKREALRRLEETEQNLLRINDIITEVRRSIGYLERQANKARRYQSTFEELKDKEIRLAIFQKSNLIEEKFKITTQLDSLKNQEEAIQSEIKDQEARISQRNIELKELQQNLQKIKDGILNSQNLIQNFSQHINFDNERIKEQDATKIYLESQISQARERLSLEEEKLNKLREEELTLKQTLAEKTESLKSNGEQLNNLLAALKISQDNILLSKKGILDMAAKISGVKNELTDLNSKQQVFLARQKRLDLEKAKVTEEKSQVEENLNSLYTELLALEKEYGQINQNLAELKAEAQGQTLSLNEKVSSIEELERKKLSLQSQKEFLEKLKNQYEDISESMNATIYLDRQPAEKMTGLVVKIKELQNADTVSASEPVSAAFKVSGEAKPIDLDAQIVIEKLGKVEQDLLSLNSERHALETQIQKLNSLILELSAKAQEQELSLANKKTVHHTVLEQYNKVKEEEEIIDLELSDVKNEMENLEAKQYVAKQDLSGLELNDQDLQKAIQTEQENINLNSKLKEEVLVVIAQVKTEIENLNSRLDSEDTSYAVLEDTVRQEKANIESLQAKISETQKRKQELIDETKEIEERMIRSTKEIELETNSLEQGQKRFEDLQDGMQDIVDRIEQDKKKLEAIKDNSYQLQMGQKDLDFKYQSLKERLMNAYKIDLDNLVSLKDQMDAVPEVGATESESQNGGVQETLPSDRITPVPGSTAVTETDKNVFNIEGIKAVDENALSSEIEKLKERIDSYGTVNLVAIEEYDELKKRYDFLTQQQTDLVTAKESLQEAIQKINRTTKKMFLETFEQVREQFWNYFRLLFNGGDAQVYLIDEQDPLESGIEIICRPPGKKLQNVLLLSGGEKSLAAIALIFAIFKVKPAPFCVLDEIDAALDESNVDRFGRLLQEFSQTAQFIVITHNKRTIANANVMYGITMQESGVSKIVSVKFAEGKKEKEKEPEPVAA
jgi:chromosome segregation protein